ncbi:RtcB family protein [bacterium]|jgi:tRNA-splicing ligase RtcB (3'-phosphate/5'-hydroxy nucleic acid ligase)|nr:RtcB family protein [bacterium]MBT5345704.1 RtcB family protein [bacterium]MBT6130786.1 RtcB family protein [bacterium]MBT6528742.1 RtcB family protein [bacterium]
MERKITIDDLVRLRDGVYQVPVTYRKNMRVPAYVFVDDEMIHDVLLDRAIEQLINVASLPGVVKGAYAMPDIHQGYGFPIGGVVATDIDEGGVISPGGIGYDINCGVRLLVANMPYDKIKGSMEELARALYQAVPSGVGRGGSLLLSSQEMNDVLQYGAAQMVKMGYGLQSDLNFCEEEGALASADPGAVSDRARQRGLDQVGTLGSGNHFIEIQRVSDLLDESIARTFGLDVDAVTVMIHCGSRGLGHQICTDYVRNMVPHLQEWGIKLPDRELACAPFKSDEGQQYFAAMNAAANFAWANRHTIGHNIRQAWKSVLGQDAELATVYDVSHNIGKLETHLVDGVTKKLLVHRKGATRAFGPGRPEICERYQVSGQPVFIPGTMGTSSYVLAGTAEGMEVAFGSTCHGAGRRMSRTKAKRTISGQQLRKTLSEKGIIIQCESDREVAEEAPIAYKDVDNVVRVVSNLGIARLVARLVPLAVIKGS